MMAVFGLGLAMLFGICSAKKPDGYIIDVVTVCDYSKDITWLASVTVTSDLPERSVSAKAECATNKNIGFLSKSSTEQQLIVYYDEKMSANNCTFKNVDHLIYTIKLMVAWGEPDSPIQQYEEQYTITCTKDSHGRNRTKQLNVDDGFLSPKEIAQNIGSVTTDIIILNVIDVLLNPLTAESIPIGKVVHLRGKISGVASYGLLATSCNASGENGEEYSLLRGGCGDGLIFNKQQGFQSSGILATSPPFGFFKFSTSNSIKFACYFSTCEHSICEQNSCIDSNSRRKRSNSAYTKEAHTRFIAWGPISVHPATSLLSGHTNSIHIGNLDTDVKMDPYVKTKNEHHFESSEFFNLESAPVSILKSAESHTPSDNKPQSEQSAQFPTMLNTHQTFWIALTLVSCLAIFSLALSTYVIIKRKRLDTIYTITGRKS